MLEKNPVSSGERIEKSSRNSFSINFSILSDRRIGGCAHFEQTDLENEIIEIDAIRKSLADFMQHPILHYQHTERPIGTITKAEIIDEGLYIEACIYDTPDTDDVWDEIQKGLINKYSIYARRLKGTPACRVSPENRISPCVTKALTLWSISAVGNNAINQATFLEVMKATLRGDDVTEVVEEIIEKADVESEEEETTLLKAETNVSGILERLGTLEEMTKGIPDFIEKCSGYFAKSEEPQVEEDVEKCSMQKAEPVVEPVDVITKAVMEDIRKAFDEKIASLEAKIAKMEEETIRKGGVVVVNPNELSEEKRNGLNPMILNAKALGGI